MPAASVLAGQGRGHPPMHAVANGDTDNKCSDQRQSPDYRGPPVGGLDDIPGMTADALDHGAAKIIVFNRLAHRFNFVPNVTRDVMERRESAG